jgi:hypothetical protein
VFCDTGRLCVALVFLLVDMRIVCSFFYIDIAQKRYKGTNYHWNNNNGMLPHPTHKKNPYKILTFAAHIKKQQR